MEQPLEAPHLHIFAAFMAAVAASSAYAGPADYVFMPAVTYGEHEIDFKYGAASKKDEPSQQAASLGLGYGATEWWFTEFYFKGEREGASNRFVQTRRSLTSRSSARRRLTLPGCYVPARGAAGAASGVYRGAPSRSR